MRCLVFWFQRTINRFPLKYAIFDNLSYESREPCNKLKIDLSSLYILELFPRRGLQDLQVVVPQIPKGHHILEMQVLSATGCQP